ncbi:FAD/NAD(P)-binding domain-containing protein [Apiospora arundinis]|uniref:FAD/NAD(P)-binding domain-containing protein n=1 Tax=Apiospora arundinis TaxID=335852 RepID=A0ABR2ITI9_9PEZI
MAIKLYPVVIVGAGISGIAMACQLKQKLGLSDFIIFDRHGGIGGTWHINKYPGVACDVPALLYSFSFAPNYGWTSLFPPGHEIVEYLRDVCSKFGITDHIKLNTEITEARWCEAEEEWELTLTHLVEHSGDLSAADRRARARENGEASVYLGSERVRAKVLISCVGGLVEPKAWPSDVKGVESFQGPIFHSARWDDRVDLTDKKVLVVGSGCSASQLVPCLTQAPYHAKSVMQIMRSPPWVNPRPATPRLWRKYSWRILSNVPGLGKLLRFLLFLGAESFWLLFGQSDASAKRRKRFEARLLNHMEKTVPEKYRGMLVPDYPAGCKRTVLDGQWLECLNDANVELTLRPLRSVQAMSVTLGPGPVDSTEEKANETVEVPADVIVLANGFDTANYLHSLKVTGIGGKSLQATWEERGGPHAYLGLGVDQFPNFFLILGPNTLSGHSSAILASENAVSYILNFVPGILSGEVRTVQVKTSALLEYTADVQARTKTKIWPKCHSWYVGNSGWNSAVCPYSQIHFTLMCMFPKWQHWDITYTQKGLATRRLRRRATYLLLVTVALLGTIWRLWK